MLTILFKRIFLLIFILLGSIIFSSEIQIEADELQYKFNYLIIASGNVRLSYQQITLDSQYAEIDTRTNEFYAFGGIDVIYEGHRFYTDVVSYTLEKDKLTFSALSATFNPVEFETPLYFTSKIINKDGNFFQGMNACLSTCPYDRQYYVIEAKRFKFYPNDKIVGYDVYCHAGIIPVFYSPYYEFKLGYVNPILLFPIVGSNLVEGNYVKTALDYYLDKDFSAIFYFDYLEFLGLGFGVDATIRKDRINPSKAYFYYIDAEHYAIKWDQSIKLPDETYRYGFQQRNLHRNTGGYDKFTEGYLNYVNKNVGDIYLYNKDNKKYSQYNEKYTWKGKIGDTINSLRVNRDNYYNTGSSRKNINLITSTKGINNNFNYTSNQYSNNNHYQYYNNKINLTPLNSLQLNADVTYKSDQKNNINDERLMPKLGLTYSLYNAPLNLRAVSLRTDMLFDLYEDRPSSDDKFSILESIPEASLSFIPFKYGLLNYTPVITIGNYHERRFIDDTFGNRDVTYQRILIRNNLNLDLIKSEHLDFTAGYGYDQYLYETQDKQYGLNETYRLDIFNGNPIQNSTRYVQYHNRGYTPFYFDEMSSYQNKRLNNSFTYKILDKTTFLVRDGYDFVNHKRDVQYFDLRHIFGNNNSLSVFTGYDYENNHWQNLQSNFTLKEDNDNYLIWRMNYLLMEGSVRDSRILLGKSFGDDEPWKVRSELIWNYFTESYSIPFVDIIRDMGCVELIYRYREFNREHTFLFRVNAFPDQTFGTTIGDAGATFQGWEQRDVSR